MKYIGTILSKFLLRDFTDIHREGLPVDRIIKTGSPIFEVLNHYEDEIEGLDALNRLKLEIGDYFVVSYIDYVTVGYGI